MEQERKQVIVMRKDLNMRKGKMIAQGAHASMLAVLNQGTFVPGEFRLALDENLQAWLGGNYKKITVSVNSEAELLELFARAEKLGLGCSIIRDAGRTEFNGVPTYTCIAIGPDIDANIDPLTGALPLL